MYVASDNRTEPVVIQELLPNAKVNKNSKIEDGNVMTEAIDKIQKSTVMPLLVDIEIMRRATAFVGTASSNLGSLIHSLRGDFTEVSVDDPHFNTRKPG